VSCDRYECCHIKKNIHGWTILPLMRQPTCEMTVLPLSSSSQITFIPKLKKKNIIPKFKNTRTDNRVAHCICHRRCSSPSRRGNSVHLHSTRQTSLFISVEDAINSDESDNRTCFPSSTQY